MALSSSERAIHPQAVAFFFFAVEPRMEIQGFRAPVAALVASPSYPSLHP